MMANGHALSPITDERWCEFLVLLHFAKIEKKLNKESRIVS